MRIGYGYDVHRLVPGRPLILGGVHIEHTVGLEGHSDADVLAHAVADAVLGAAAMGDIGDHFPDTDPAYAGAESLLLLRHAVQLVREAGYEIANIDSVIIAQAPKMKPYKEEMRKNLAAATGLTPDQLNVKATTEEGLGFTGEKKGIAAKAVCLLLRTE
ncbi:MAG: 2-C-methyl-D-erythritol 2,4-cyclodiphosphate synthase [Eubacteriales bacterium]|nr:2-C-methyl-D-erythritol 2,4-cyclodiphosphate synthase [Eubacteriales bacterium]